MPLLKTENEGRIFHKEGKFAPEISWITVAPSLQFLGLAGAPGETESGAAAIVQGPSKLYTNECVP